VKQDNNMNLQIIEQKNTENHETIRTLISINETDSMLIEESVDFMLEETNQIGGKLSKVKQNEVLKLTSLRIDTQNSKTVFKNVQTMRQRPRLKSF
jgi:hypothetical protein